MGHEAAAEQSALGSKTNPALLEVNSRISSDAYSQGGRDILSSQFLNDKGVSPVKDGQVQFSNIYDGTVNCVGTGKVDTSVVKRDGTGPASTPGKRDGGPSVNTTDGASGRTGTDTTGRQQTQQTRPQDGRQSGTHSRQEGPRPQAPVRPGTPGADARRPVTPGQQGRPETHQPRGGDKQSVDPKWAARHRELARTNSQENEIRETGQRKVQYGDTPWDIAKGSLRARNGGKDPTGPQIENEMTRLGKINGIDFRKGFPPGTVIETREKPGTKPDAPKPPDASKPPEPGCIPKPGTIPGDKPTPPNTGGDTKPPTPAAPQRPGDRNGPETEVGPPRPATPGDVRPSAPTPPQGDNPSSPTTPPPEQKPTDVCPRKPPEAPPNFGDMERHAEEQRRAQEREDNLKRREDDVKRREDDVKRREEELKRREDELKRDREQQTSGTDEDYPQDDRHAF